MAEMRNASAESAENYRHDAAHFADLARSTFSAVQACAYRRAAALAQREAERLEGTEGHGNG